MLARVENGVALVALSAMVLLALTEVAGRALFQVGVPGSIVLVQHLTLWVALLGAALAARSDRLLALSTPHFLPERWRLPTRVATATVATAIAATLTLASIDLINVERRSDDHDDVGLVEGERARAIEVMRIAGRQETAAGAVEVAGNIETAQQRHRLVVAAARPHLLAEEDRGTFRIHQDVSQPLDVGRIAD